MPVHTRLCEGRRQVVKECVTNLPHPRVELRKIDPVNLRVRICYQLHLDPVEAIPTRSKISDARGS